jgi:hypothetical protein
MAEEEVDTRSTRSPEPNAGEEEEEAMTEWKERRGIIQSRLGRG